MTSDRFRDIFRRGSRTYFHASLFFAPDVRGEVTTLYAFVRTADDYVDRVPPDGAGFAAFVDRYRAGLAGATTGDPVVDAFVDLAARKAFDPAWTDAFLATMRQDLTECEYATLEAVESYMYGSAEVIGLYMARLLDLPEASLPAARRLGRAMQYINFLRDIGQDLDFGRTYIPRSLIDLHGLSGLDPAAAAAVPAGFEALVRSEVARYRLWQAEAEEGYPYLPFRCRVPIQTAADMYGWTADTLERNPWVVFERQVKPSAPRVVWRLVVNALAVGLPWPRGSAGAARWPRHWFG